jgi:hypothetical protein
MGIGISILLIAAGAVLKWAVNADSSSFDLNMIGVILMVVGAIGLLWALAVSSAMPWRRDVDDGHVHRV